MPRDGAGLYSLPAGNPVVTNTVIASAWANTTMSDIAAQLNNVLTRDGLLGPTGPFKLQDGTVAAPGLAFNSEPGLGWYRKSAGNISMAVGGTERFAFSLAATGSANIVLNKSVVASTNGLYGDLNGAHRWGLTLGDASAESGSNAGSEFNLIRFDDTGTTGVSVLRANRMNGFVTIGPGTPQTPGGADTASAGFYFSKTGSGSANLLVGTLNSLNRWVIRLGDSTAESGSNAGSDYTMSRYNDAGVNLGTPLSISRATGVATFSAAIVNGPSDRSLKENIEPIENALDRVLALQGVSFSMLATPGQREIGLIAQDVQPVVPEVIQPFGEGKLSIDYPKLTALLINAIKTLHERLSHLELHPA